MTGKGAVDIGQWMLSINTSFHLLKPNHWNIRYLSLRLDVSSSLQQLRDYLQVAICNGLMERCVAVLISVE
jgi:hypothetical protein